MKKERCDNVNYKIVAVDFDGGDIRKIFAHEYIDDNNYWPHEYIDNY